MLAANHCVASAKPAVIYRADGKPAAKIAAENIGSYAIRDAVIQAGKMPSQDCNP